MRKCLIASSNVNKAREVQEILKDFNFEVLTTHDVEEELEVIEDADSFTGNALLKAKAYHERYPEYYVLADDSGLMIEALDGRPGIYSARYGGDLSYPEKFKLIWSELAETGVDPNEWRAKFVCAIAWCEPGVSLSGEVDARVFQGEMHGIILNEARGENGFGYDPIFYLPEFRKTNAEISPEEKNKISHRGRALSELQKYLKN